MEENGRREKEGQKAVDNTKYYMNLCALSGLPCFSTFYQHDTLLAQEFFVLIDGFLYII